MSYRAHWPFGVALSLAFLEACSPIGDRPKDNQPYGGASGYETGGASGAGPGGANGAGPGGAAGGDAGANGAGPSGAAGDGPGGVGGGVGGDAGFGGDAGVGGIGGDAGVGGLPPFDGGTDPARNRVPGGPQVCDRLATIQCAAEVSCCSAPGRNFDQCKQAQNQQCLGEAHLDAITANPITGYNIDRAEAAFAEFERLASLCDPIIAQWAARIDGLRGMLLGTISAGESCGPPDSDPAVGGARLASCLDGANNACLPVSLFTWTCRPRGQAGSPCFSDFNCVDGVYCDNPNLDPTGARCVQRKPETSPCGLGNECLSLACRGGTCAPPSVSAAYCLAVR